MAYHTGKTVTKTHTKIEPGLCGHGLPYRENCNQNTHKKLNQDPAWPEDTASHTEKTVTKALTNYHSHGGGSGEEGTKPIVFSCLPLVPLLVWCFWGMSPCWYSPWSSLTFLTGEWWGIYLLRLGTLAVKVPRVLADMVFSGKSFQSLMVRGYRYKDCLYWMRHRIKKSYCEQPLHWQAAAGISFDLSTLTSSWSIL